MKKRDLLRVLAALCAAVLLAGVGIRLVPLAQAEDYQVGDAEISAPVESLEISWDSGKVHIAYHSKDTVIISESSSGVLSDGMRMRWRLDGRTLKIQFDKPGLHLFSFLPQEKELTVTLPQTLALDKAAISSASADLEIPALRADKIKLETASGDIRAKLNAKTIRASLSSGDLEMRVMNTAEEITLSATSGDIILESAGAEKNCSIRTASGDIQAAVKAAKEFKASSASGDIHAVIGEAKKAEIDTASGKVTVEMLTLEELKVRTASGGVDAYLPRSPGFTAQIETASGQFTSALSMTKQGKNYVYGDGGAYVSIHTASGNITIGERDE